MGLNLNTTDVNTAAAAVTATGKALKPKAKIWLNPGILVPFAGEDEATFVGLEAGIPMDTMDAAKTAYSSPKMRALGNAKNQLRDAILKAAEGKQPGDTFMIDLKCQVRIVNEESAAAPADVDVVSAALAGLIIG